LNPGHKDNDQRTGKRERTIRLVIQRELKEKHRWKETGGIEEAIGGDIERKKGTYSHSTDRQRFMISLNFVRDNRLYSYMSSGFQGDKIL
jgi:hypothetical protein